MSPKLKAFLAAYELCGSVTKSAEAAGIDRSLHYQALKADPGYPDAFDQAEKCWADTIEGKARQWAQEGIEEPIYQQGHLVGYKTKIPQSLVIRILEGAKPDRYRTNYHVDGNITHTGLSALTDAELERIALGGSGGATPAAPVEEQVPIVLPGDGATAAGVVSEAPGVLSGGPEAPGKTVPRRKSRRKD